MSCRRGSNAPITGSAAAITGAPTVIVEKAFHALKREGVRLGVGAPSPEEVVGFLHARRELLKSTPGIGMTRMTLHKIGLSQARERAEDGEVPDGATWHAWQHVLGEAEARVQVERREAAIFDIDGTLSDNGPMREVPLPPPGPEANYDHWMSHTPHLGPNDWVRDATHQVDESTERVVLTARSERYRAMTEEWLARHDAKYDVLVMRPDDDRRPDHEFKQEALDRLERERDFVFAMDDNPHVAQMWRDNDIEVIVVPGFGDGVAPPPGTGGSAGSR